ncbi:MAG: UDP-N-acetylmuramate--L-alanine ligase [Elusimicrobia bacterium]|nr:UDP-N-acetylmuramate--L-alanine ligase [Candidatus Liberimonas magnetica]
MFKKIQHIHFVGIGGAGMSGIAEVLLNLGYEVSGSDLKRTEVTDYLKNKGAKIFIGHNKRNIKDADVVVTSTAVKRDNPEVVVSLKKKIPVIPRIEMLAELARLKYTISIAGTHGKTTTTSLTALVVEAGGFDPTVVIGGRLKNKKSGAKLGKGEFLVAEADESDGSFLKLSPAIAVVTNIDNDHLDYYGTFENIKAAFVQHINSIPFYGCAILCGDDPNIVSVLPDIKRRYNTYGLRSGADFRAVNVKQIDFGFCFDVLFKGKKLGKITLAFPGEHNILNTLAAVAVGKELDIPFNKIASGIRSFSGVGRRLEIKGSKKGITVIDDYGHHPTEIKASLAAIKKNWPDKKLTVLFQPHRYSRTAQLYNEFGSAFKMADEVKLLQIYPAGENPIQGVTSRLIYNSVQKNGTKIEDYSSLEVLLRQVKSGDILLTLGAGDVYKIGEELLKRI